MAWDEWRDRMRCSVTRCTGSFGCGHSGNRWRMAVNVRSASRSTHFITAKALQMPGDDGGIDSRCSSSVGDERRTRRDAVKIIRRLVRSAAVFVALLSVAPPAAAQVAETGTIEVSFRIRGLAIPGATVIASAADTVTKRAGHHRYRWARAARRPRALGAVHRHDRDRPASVPRATRTCSCVPARRRRCMWRSSSAG